MYKLPPAKIFGGTIESLLGKFKVEDGMFFKAITGLANGVYGVKITEFDKSEKPLFSIKIYANIIKKYAKEHTTYER